MLFLIYPLVLSLSKRKNSVVEMELEEAGQK